MSVDAQPNIDDSRGSGHQLTPEPRHLVVGRVLRPHGVRGEVRVEVLTAYPERLGEHAWFYLAPAEAPDDVSRHRVERVRPHGNIVLVKFAGYEDRDAADELRDMLVKIATETAVPLDEGELYVHQIIGLDAETDVGEWLGKVVEVIETGANDVYLIRGPRGEVLLPAVRDVVVDVDLAEGKLLVHLMPGILDDDDDTWNDASSDGVHP
jgi:16S rRNA processing protein RimM